jgi:hypothetical protein
VHIAELKRRISDELSCDAAQCRSQKSKRKSAPSKSRYDDALKKLNADRHRL